LAVLLAVAVVMGVRAWHDSLVNSRPASQQVSVTQYQSMLSSDEQQVLSKQANVCAVLGDAAQPWSRAWPARCRSGSTT
jgi:hypothetical protein